MINLLKSKESFKGCGEDGLKWYADRMFMMVPAQEYVANQLATLKEFPPAKGSSLSLGKLIEADLRDDQLIGANLSGAKMIGADLSGANLSHANLSQADLFNANLNRADLIEADLSGATLGSARLVTTDLSGRGPSEWRAQSPQGRGGRARVSHACSLLRGAYSQCENIK